MDKLDGNVIDFCALERELRGAVESDQRFQRENDAKFRAVNQNVASYQDFSEIVLACHLKPLEKKDKNSASFRQPWNPLVTARKHNLPISPRNNSLGGSLSSNSPPASPSNKEYTGNPDP